MNKKRKVQSSLVLKWLVRCYKDVWFQTVYEIGFTFSGKKTGKSTFPACFKYRHCDSVNVIRKRHFALRRQKNSWSRTVVLQNKIFVTVEFS